MVAARLSAYGSLRHWRREQQAVKAGGGKRQAFFPYQDKSWWQFLGALWLVRGGLKLVLSRALLLPTLVARPDRRFCSALLIVSYGFRRPIKTDAIMILTGQRAVWGVVWAEQIRLLERR
jgi:hypothetical protein